MSERDAPGTANDLQRAEALCDLRRFGEARALLQRIVAADPDNDYAWCLISRTCYELDDYADGVAAANSALRIDPEEEWAHRLASLNLALLGDHRGAVEAANNAVRAAPHQWQTHAQMARALAFAGWDHATAAAAAWRAVELDPNATGAHLAVAIAARLRGDVPTARQACAKVLAIDPENIGGHTELAALETISGVPSPMQRASALSRLGTVMRIDPTRKESRENADGIVVGTLGRVTFFELVSLYAASVLIAGGAGWVDRSALAACVWPAGFLLQFWRGLPASLRPYVIATVRRRLAAAVLLGVAFVCCLVGAAVSDDLRNNALAAAVGATSLSALVQFAQLKLSDEPDL
ncbi:MAG: tetratricopeptide repeat protein [Mycobacteriales bacterium]